MQIYTEINLTVWLKVYDQQPEDHYFYENTPM